MQLSSREETKACITTSASLKLKTASRHFVDNKNRTGPAADVIVKTEARIKKQSSVFHHSLDIVSSGKKILLSSEHASSLGPSPESSFFQK